MSKNQLNISNLVLCAIALALIFIGHAGTAKTIWPEEHVASDQRETPLKTGAAFRLVGDRSGTIWLSVEGRSRHFPNGPRPEQIAFNQDAVLGTVEFLASREAEPSSGSPQDTTASFVSRKAATVAEPKGSAMVPWPLLLLSALAGLGLWANQRRNSA